MKKFLFTSFALICSAAVFAQKVDSISFNLYTDSLKKGRHNYISVDGKFSNGIWQPLTQKEIEFSTSSGKFEGNELILPADLKDEKVKVKAVLKSNPAIWKEITIWIKTLPEPARLPTNEEILKPSKRNKKN